MPPINGAMKLVKSLITKGVKDIFGYPGGAVLPVLDALAQQGAIKYYLCRTEQGGGFMADGYANATDRVGVVCTTSGPGALNTVTCLQNALSDGTSIVALTGQVSTAVLGTDAFQEADVIGITKPCTKWNVMIRDSGDVERYVNDAFRISVNKRHGPVLLDLPKNIMSGDFCGVSTVATSWLPPLEKTSTADWCSITEMILAAKQPVILAGRGVLKSGPEAVANLRLLAKHYNIPVTTTLLGLGAFCEKDDLSLKMLGMHGSYAANMSIQNCDLLLNFGSRFDDRITGKVSGFAPLAKIVHVDICGDNINKVIKTPYYINLSCSGILKELVEKCTADLKCEYKVNNAAWINTINSWKRKYPFIIPKGKAALQGREVIDVLNRVLYLPEFMDKRFLVVADVGAHQMWAAQFIDYDYDRVRFLTSGGLGSMGYAVPAGIGASIGVPNHIVVCICGDGGFTMSFAELLTAVENKINVKVIVINNSYQLMVKMWQDKFHEGRRIGVKMNNPPFDLVCRAMGCETLRIDSADGIEDKLRGFLLYTGGPIVANVITDSDETVLPMVSPGKALDDMIVNDEGGQLTGEAPC
jgi:acetolactate synthase-1/2/3 large subunit